VGVTTDPVWDTGAHRPVLVADLDRGQIERIEHALDFATNEGDVDFEDVAVDADGRCFGDGAMLGPQERFMQLGWGRDRERAACDEPVQRCLFRFGMDPTVIGGLDAAGEQSVHLDQITDLAACELDQELNHLVAPAPDESTIPPN
jgi:hypothetical protein